jgi:twitching motility protein PilT
MIQQQFDRYLQSAVGHNASDIHFKVGLPVAFRIQKKLIPAKQPPLSAADTVEICRFLIKDPKVLSSLDTLMDYDTAYVLPGLSRFRVNIFRQRGTLSIILRVIADIIPSIESLMLPPKVHQLASYERGLVLITGAAGAGKSSTLAAIIRKINETRSCHIITIEDPIEFVHKDRLASVSQREVGIDTVDFNNALRAALRQDPDVILVGEMRDLETIDIVLKAAETGHLVYSTVHTPDAVRTIGRLIAVFPPEEQQMVRVRLAENLQATLSQRLVPKKNGNGMVVASELMFSNGTIEDAIRNPELTATIKDIIERSGDQYGMMSFDQCLTDLYKGELISLEMAKKFASNPSDFERALHFD